VAYHAPIQRSDPKAFLSLVDQSGSISDRMAASEKTNAEFVADVLNRTLMNVVTRCTKVDGVRHYFEAGVIGYGAGAPKTDYRGLLAVVW
jgi:hypothetical protein